MSGCYGADHSLSELSEADPEKAGAELKVKISAELLRPTLRRPYLLPEDGAGLLTPSTYAVDDCEFGGGGAPS